MSFRSGGRSTKEYKKQAQRTETTNGLSKKAVFAVQPWGSSYIGADLRKRV